MQNWNISDSETSDLYLSKGDFSGTSYNPDLVFQGIVKTLKERGIKYAQQG